MRQVRTSWLALSAFSLSGALVADAEAAPRAPSRECSPARFNRVATLPNYLNNTDPSGATVSEIIAANASGNTLIYTDSLLEEIGFLDITDTSAAAPLGKLGVGGEPTSVAGLGENLALVAVNTRESFVDPSGHLAVVDIAAQQIVAELDLGGQPDSVAISPSHRFAAVVIENERDEAVVTLQENNHVIVIDLASGAVVNHFPAGEVALSGVDGAEDGVISLTDSITVAREPDAVTWLPGRRGGLIATANEGDLFGGSRGFSIFDRRGRVVFDSGSSLEQLAVRHGHYPESRSDAKGTEPEAIEYARFGDTDYLFVASERGSFVAVYELTQPGQPEFVQLLPAPLGPEGVRAIPERGLLVVSGEEDSPPFGVRSSVMIYQLGDGAQTYPHIVSSDDAAGQPIAWSALSGMATVPGRSRELLAVWDSYYSESRIFSIDAARSPARITQAVTLTGGSGNYDPEGIAIAPDGTLWIASEGNDAGRPNLLIQADAAGNVLREVGLPAEVEACRAATQSRRTLGSGFEGVSVAPARDGYTLIAPQQRGWDYTTPECEALDDDATGTNPAEPASTRLWTYDPAADAWTFVAYDLEPLPPNAGWVGLSEISTVPGGYILIERDNLSGDFARLKTLAQVKRRALADGRVTRDEKQSHDFLPELLATHGWVTDKPEGVAVTGDGQLFVVTDNDGVEDWSGETWFLRLGNWLELFR